MKNLYTCQCCHKTFEPTRSYEEAINEKEQLFPSCQEKFDLVCDNCFEKIMKHNEGDNWREKRTKAKSN